MTLFGDFVTGQTLSFQRMRALLLEGGGGLQEGVVGANDLKVAQRGAGANMSADIPAGAAWVQIDTGTRNGLAHVYNDATANVAVTASNATNPRIDQAILRYNDTSIPTGSGNVPTLEVLTGTATAGATLDNRTGAAALPNDCLRLADILVPATSTSVTTANIRDRRPWARGAYVESNGGLPTTGPNFGAGGAGALAGLTQRIECSGAPLVIESYGYFRHQGVAGTLGNHQIYASVDGAAAAAADALVVYAANVVDFYGSAAGRHQYTLAAGSHLLDLRLVVSVAATIGLNQYGFRAYEMVKPFANDGTA